MKKSIQLVLPFLMVLGISTAIAEEGLAPETVEGATTVDAAAAKALFDGGSLFVDPRNQNDYDAGRVPGAEHLPVKSEQFTEANLLELADTKDEKVVFYCNGVKCKLSTMATEKAVGFGFTNVFYFRAGFPAWKAANYPVE